MVRGNVQDHGDAGMELIGALKLEAGDLDDRPGFVGALLDEPDHREADVASYQGGYAGLLKNFAHQRGGRGLAVGAGDGQHLALEKAGGQFKFADDRQAEAFHLRQFGGIQRHAGTDHDQVLAAEGEQTVASGLHHDALFKQGRDLL